MTRELAATMADYLLAIDSNARLAREMQKRCDEPEVVAELANEQAQQLAIIRLNVDVLLKGETT